MSILQPIQFMYEPMSVEKIPPLNSDVTPIRAFSIATFDHRANPFMPQLIRPWLLEVPVPSGASDPSKLLLFQYQDGSQRWTPLLTTWDKKSNVLATRLLSVGYFAVAIERPPY